jgi:hypothetical protein
VQVQVQVQVQVPQVQAQQALLLVGLGWEQLLWSVVLQQQLQLQSRSGQEVVKIATLRAHQGLPAAISSKGGALESLFRASAV